MYSQGASFQFSSVNLQRGEVVWYWQGTVNSRKIWKGWLYMSVESPGHEGGSSCYLWTPAQRSLRTPGEDRLCPQIGQLFPLPDAKTLGGCYR